MYIYILLRCKRLFLFSFNTTRIHFQTRKPTQQKEGNGKKCTERAKNTDQITPAATMATGSSNA
jgi:hypothetical protein